MQTSQVYWHYVLVTMAPPAPCMLDVTVGLTDSNATADGNTKVKVGLVQLWRFGLRAHEQVKTARGFHADGRLLDEATACIHLEITSRCTRP